MRQAGRLDDKEERGVRGGRREGRGKRSGRRGSFVTHEYSPSTIREAGVAGEVYLLAPHARRLTPFLIE